MKDIVLPMPRSIDEQRAIVGAPEQRVLPLVAEISTTEREIEPRAHTALRLVADVVTGKL